MRPCAASTSPHCARMSTCSAWYRNAGARITARRWLQNLTLCTATAASCTPLQSSSLFWASWWLEWWQLGETASTAVRQKWCEALLLLAAATAEHGLQDHRQP